MVNLKDIYRKNVFKFGNATFTLESQIPSFQAPWGIITAWNPNNLRFPSAMNTIRNKRLYWMLKRLGYTSTLGKGGLGKHFEESFLIESISLKNTLKFGRFYQQYSIFWCDGKRSGYYLCKDGNSIV